MKNENLSLSLASYSELSSDELFEVQAGGWKLKVVLGVAIVVFVVGFFNGCSETQR